MKRLTDMTDYVLGVYSEMEERLMDIEDILGDEYDLDRLRELAQADREGWCVVFVSGYPVVSIYGKAEDGLCIREVSGVITEEEYKSALRREQE